MSKLLIIYRLSVILGSLCLVALWWQRSSSSTQLGLQQTLNELLHVQSPLQSLPQSHQTNKGKHGEAGKFVSYDDDDDDRQQSTKVFEMFHDVSVSDRQAYVRPEDVTDDGFVDTKRYSDDRFDSSFDGVEGSQEKDSKLKATDDISSDKYNSTLNYPSLDQLYDNSTNQIIGDVQFLLDFAMIGSPYAGASHLAKWLRKHGNVQLLSDKSLQRKQPSQLVQVLHANLMSTAKNNNNNTLRRGYVNTKDVQSAGSAKFVAQHFARTKLVVVLQHPVRWFERWYNHQQQRRRRMRRHDASNISSNNNNNTIYMLPPAETLVGAAMPDQVRVHVHLSLWLHTEHDARARQLLDVPFALWRQKQNIAAQHDNRRRSNHILLLETRQLYDEDADRRAALRRDIKSFLKLDGDSIMDNDEPIMVAPIKVTETSETAINICETKYYTLRQELMEISMRASVWIIHYVMNNPKVKISERHYFETLVRDWHEDPCAKVVR
ncbi:hypothetical protein MPSEU_000321700 [Mayamaea pseudoterrestris]|nr:hypothetical protein MPSEU_000321700 [Mayamaea pseudoterrestris]